MSPHDYRQSIVLVLDLQTFDADTRLATFAQRLGEDHDGELYHHFALEEEDWAWLGRPAAMVMTLTQAEDTATPPAPRREVHWLMLWTILIVVLIILVVLAIAGRV